MPKPAFRFFFQCPFHDDLRTVGHRQQLNRFDDWFLADPGMGNLSFLDPELLHLSDRADDYDLVFIDVPKSYPANWPRMAG